MSSFNLPPIGKGPRCDGYVRGLGPTYAFSPHAAKPLPNVPPAPPVDPVLLQQIRERGVTFDKHETPEEWWYCQADFYGRPVPEMWCWIYPGPVGSLPESSLL